MQKPGYGLLDIGRRNPSDLAKLAGGTAPEESLRNIISVPDPFLTVWLGDMRLPHNVHDIVRFGSMDGFLALSARERIDTSQKPRKQKPWRLSSLTTPISRKAGLHRPGLPRDAGSLCECFVFRQSKALTRGLGDLHLFLLAQIVSVHRLEFVAGEVASSVRPNIIFLLLHVMFDQFLENLGSGAEFGRHGVGDLA